MASTQEILSDELANDPLGWGYAQQTDEVVSMWINNSDSTSDPVHVREQDRTVIDVWEIFEAEDPNEVESVPLSGQQQQWKSDLLSMGLVDIQGSNTRTTLRNIYSPGASYPLTRQNLADIQTEDISRATELGIPATTPGSVSAART